MNNRFLNKSYKLPLTLSIVVIAIASYGANAPRITPVPKVALKPPATLPTTFVNPLVRSRDAADPWLVYRNGFYYFTFTVGKSIEVWKSRSITGLDAGEKVTVWRAPDKGPNAEDIWAPEIHFVRGKWYIYFTATDGSDLNRRQFVLEANTDDPLGSYTEKGQIVVPGADVYAIDGTVFETEKGALYFLWSGRAENKPGTQNLYIAPMANPWTLAGPRVSLSQPTFDWERHGWAVNEGPEVLTKNGKTFLVYSASGGTTPDYCLGMLTNTDGNLLRAESWTKSPVPVFQKYTGPDGAVYTPGHNGFCLSPDGKQDWIIYHGKENTDGTWGGRMARAQRFVWNSDGFPYFGHPVPAGVRLATPSGDNGIVAMTPGKGTGLLGEYFQEATPGTKPPQRTRLDSVIGFHWTPLPGKAGMPEGASVRWRGTIVPRFDDTYTLQTFSAGGVRVWLDNKRLIDNWVDHPATTDQELVTLSAGRRYNLCVEYRTGADAQIMLAWSSPRQPFEIVPTDVLFPAGKAATVPLTPRAKKMPTIRAPRAATATRGHR